MNLKLKTLLIAGVTTLISSCGKFQTPVNLYANTANTLVSIEEGIAQESEFTFMVEDGQLRIQEPDFMDQQATSAYQNDWLEVREIFETLRESQRLQNQLRILIKMEASLLTALATTIEENAITLTEASAFELAEAQANLDETKATIQTTRNEIQSLVIALRTLIRSVNRPSMWNDNLILDVKAVLLELLPLVDTLTTHLTVVLPSLKAMRDLLNANIPSALSPITDNVLVALGEFENSLIVLNTLQNDIKTIRQETRLMMKEIRDLVRNMKTNNITLSDVDKAALALKRLAMQDAFASLKTLGDESKSLMQSLRGRITFTNLDVVNETLASLIVQGEERLSIIHSIHNLLLEAIAILES